MKLRCLCMWPGRRAVVSLVAVVCLAGVCGCAHADQAQSGHPSEQVSPTQQTEQGLQYATSFYGNSWPGGPKWVQTYIAYLDVLPDGRVLTNSGWDEAHREGTIYTRDGEIYAGVPKTRGRTIAADDTFVYAPIEEGGKLGVARFRLNERRPRIRPHTRDGLQFTTEAPVVDLKRGQRPYNARFWNAWLPKVEYRWRIDQREVEIRNDPAAADKYRRPPQQIRGLASSGRELFVAEDVTHRIHVLDTRSLQVKRSFPFRYPGDIALDGKGHLWIVKRPDVSEGKIPWMASMEQGHYQVVQYTTQGRPTGKVIDDVGIVTAISYGGPDEALYVADVQPDRMNVRIYDVAGTPNLLDTFGEAGGIYRGSNPGELVPGRLAFLSGVGVDDQGNVYVSSAMPEAGSFIRRYDRQGNMIWQRYCAIFSHAADFDRGVDGRVIYGKSGKFTMDYTRPPGEEGSWSAFTIDPFRYPDDPRLRSQTERGGASIGHTTLVRRLNGRVYLYNIGTLFSVSCVRKDSDSELFVPSTVIFGRPTRGNYPPNRPDGPIMWRDADGDGQMDADEYTEWADMYGWCWWVDDAGGIWLNPERRRSQIMHLPVTGFDEHGNPIYRLDAMKRYDRPAPFGPSDDSYTIQRLAYDAKRDVMFAAGWSTRLGKETGHRGFGDVIVRYENWTTNPTIRSEIELPVTDEEFRSFAAAGDLIFVTRSKAINVDSNTKANTRVYDSRDGRFLGTMAVGEIAHGETGWVDIPYGLNAMRRSNGEHLVTVEENWKSKQLLYRIPPQQLVEQR